MVEKGLRVIKGRGESIERWRSKAINVGSMVQVSITGVADQAGRVIVDSQGWISIVMRDSVFVRDKNSPGTRQPVLNHTESESC